jgi:hypothetical protein
VLKSAWVGMAAVLVGTPLAIVALVSTRKESPSASLTREQLQKYETEVVAVARDAGEVIEQGRGGARSMKHALNDIKEGRLTGPDLAREAAAWRTAMGDARSRMAAIDPPPSLAAGHRKLVASMASFEQVAVTLGDIANTQATPESAGAVLSSALDRAEQLGRQGDKQYDDGAAAIQAARHRLGLPSSPDLPDPGRAVPPGVTIVEEP